MSKPSRARTGFTYIGVLIFVAFTGISLALTAQVWATISKREKERQLLFVGNEYRQAIRRYYERTPGPVKEYPKALEDLLHDRRQLAVHRYLRRLYADPVTDSMQWGFVKNASGGITGVYSLSDKAPLKVADFREEDAEFEAKSHYLEWKFVYRGQQTPAPLPTTTTTLTSAPFPGSGGPTSTSSDMAREPGSLQPAAAPAQIHNVN